jgi:hypothetical protein
MSGGSDVRAEFGGCGYITAEQHEVRSSRRLFKAKSVSCDELLLMVKSSSNTLTRKFKDAAFVGVRYLWRRINDLYLNIDTSDESHHRDFDPQRGFPYAKPQEKAKHKDSIIYQGANFWNIRRIIRSRRLGVETSVLA